MEHRCNCGSAHDTTELGISYNLYAKIDKDRVQCLNEHEEGSGAKVFKTWEERLDRSLVSPRKFLFYKYQVKSEYFFIKHFTESFFLFYFSMLRVILMLSFCLTYRKYFKAIFIIK